RLGGPRDPDADDHEERDGDELARVAAAREVEGLLQPQEVDDQRGDQRREDAGAEAAAPRAQHHGRIEGKERQARAPQGLACGVAPVAIVWPASSASAYAKRKLARLRSLTQQRTSSRSSSRAGRT